MITGNEYKKIILKQLAVVREICLDIVKHNASSEVLNYVDSYKWIKREMYEDTIGEPRIVINVGEIYGHILLNEGKIYFDEYGLRVGVYDVYDYVYKFLTKRSDDWYKSSEYISNYNGDEIKEYNYKSM